MLYELKSVEQRLQTLLVEIFMCYFQRPKVVFDEKNKHTNTSYTTVSIEGQVSINGANKI